jgi:hypothetical protein
MANAAEQAAMSAAQADAGARPRVELNADDWRRRGEAAASIYNQFIAPAIGYPPMSPEHKARLSLSPEKRRELAEAEGRLPTTADEAIKIGKEFLSAAPGQTPGQPAQQSPWQQLSQNILRGLDQWRREEEDRKRQKTAERMRTAQGRLQPRRPIQRPAVNVAPEPSMPPFGQWIAPLGLPGPQADALGQVLGDVWSKHGMNGLTSVLTAVCTCVEYRIGVGNQGESDAGDEHETLLDGFTDTGCPGL